MPDWKRIVRKNLRVLGVCSPEFTEELAAHLEDNYEALLCEGLPAEVAFQRTMGQIKGRQRVWLVMRFLQEELMSDFMREAALPGLLTSAAAWSFYRVLALSHIPSKVIWLLGGQLPLWWWCLLPICGALGAILSQRNRGLWLQRIAASLLPSATLGTLILLLFAVGFTLTGFVNHHWWTFARLESLGLVSPGFVIMPAAFSLLGAAIAEVRTRKIGRLA